MKASLTDIFNGWSIGLTAAVGAFLWVLTKMFATGRTIGIVVTELKEVRADISKIEKDVRDIHNHLMK